MFDNSAKHVSGTKLVDPGNVLNARCLVGSPLVCSNEMSSRKTGQNIQTRARTIFHRPYVICTPFLLQCRTCVFQIILAMLVLNG